MISAELAAKDHGEVNNTVNLLYNQLSSDDDDDDDTSIGSPSKEESNSPDPYLYHTDKSHHTTTADNPPPVTSHVTTDNITFRVPSEKAVLSKTEDTSVDAAGKRLGAESGKNDATSCSEDDSSDDHEVRGRIASASMRSLTSLFGQTEEFLEQEIAKSVGLEQLTRLARATSARVVVDSLSLDPTAIDKIITHNHKQRKEKSSLPPSRAASKIGSALRYSS